MPTTCFENATGDFAITFRVPGFEINEPDFITGLMPNVIKLFVETIDRYRTIELHQWEWINRSISLVNSILDYQRTVQRCGLKALSDVFFNNEHLNW